MLARLLQAPAYASVAPLTSLSFTAEDLYPPTHWARRGTPPAFDTPDEDVYLPGRNVMLLSKAAIHCARHGLDRIALGSLAGNPFPDATPAFFAAMADALSQGLAYRLAIEAPLSHLHKEGAISLGHELGVPFELTISCMNPSEGRHCGRCSKCRERRDGFRAAGVDDPTPYAAPPIR